MKGNAGSIRPPESELHRGFGESVDSRRFPLSRHGGPLSMGPGRPPRSLYHRGTTKRCPGRLPKKRWPVQQALPQVHRARGEGPMLGGSQNQELPSLPPRLFEEIENLPFLQGFSSPTPSALPHHLRATGIRGLLVAVFREWGTSSSQTHQSSRYSPSRRRSCRVRRSL